MKLNPGKSVVFWRRTYRHCSVHVGFDDVPRPSARGLLGNNAISGNNWVLATSRPAGRPPVAAKQKSCWRKSSRRSWRDRYAYSPREAIGKVRDFRKPRGKFVACERQMFLLRSSPVRDVSRGGNIDLRHQYGISVAESQTFLIAKRPSAAISEEKLLPFDSLPSPLVTPAPQPLL